MNEKFDPIEELLALTPVLPRSGLSFVSDWRPFTGGNTLREMMIAFNHRCQRSFESKAPGLLHRPGRGIPPIINIAPYDLAHLYDLPFERYDSIKIIMLDLAAAVRHEEEIAWLCEAVAQADHRFYLVQVASSPNALSYTDYFRDLPQILPTQPEIFYQQAQFEAFLDRLCQHHLEAWMGINQNLLAMPAGSDLPDDLALMPTGPASLPELAVTVRDVAAARHLLDVQTVNLGQAAAMQECVLAGLAEQLRPYPSHPILLDAIRKPLEEIPATWPFEIDDLYPVALLAVRYAPSRLEPTIGEMETLERLGFSGQPATAVFFDEPDIGKELENVQGLVKVTPLTADLIHWQTGQAHLERELTYERQPTN